MPMTCQNCQAANPDGNSFCVRCGRPLAAAAAGAVQTASVPPQVSTLTNGPAASAGGASPTAAEPPPPPVPGAPVPPERFSQPGQSAFYQPPPPPAGTSPAALHRTPRNAAIAGGAALAGVAAVAGIVFALAHHSSPPRVAPVSTITHPTAPAVPATTPPPATSPPPTTSPAPSGPATGGGTLNVPFASASLPADITQNTTSSTATSIELDQVNGNGAVFISATSPPAAGVTDSQSALNAALQGYQKTSPDAAWCADGGNPVVSNMGGDNNALITSYVGVVCVTLTPQGGQASPTEIAMNYAYVTGPNGPEVISMEVWDDPSDFNTFLNGDGAAIAQSLTWHGMQGS